MPVAIPERIVLDLKARLEQIQIVNGYTFDVRGVLRTNRDGEGGETFDKTIEIRLADPVEVPELYHSGNPPAICYDLPIQLVVFLTQDDKETDESLTDQAYRSEVHAQVVKAITAPDLWHQFAECSFDATYSQMTTHETDDGSEAGFTLTVTPRYRVSETDPYEVRA